MITKNTKVLICGYFTPLLKVKVRVIHRSWVNIDLWNQSAIAVQNLGSLKYGLKTNLQESVLSV